jgi:hypothetical protein
VFDGWRPRLRASYILEDKSSGDLEDHCLKRSFMDDCFAILPRVSESARSSFSEKSGVLGSGHQTIESVKDAGVSSVKSSLR